MKPLVVTPIKRGNFFRLAFDAMLKLEWPDQLDYHWMLGGDDAPEPYENITRKYNQARDMVLRGGYDAIFIVESDVIVPPNALKKLAAVDADVVYGLTVFRHGWPVWNASIYINDDHSHSFSMEPEVARKWWGKVAPVAGVGFPCVLIRRHVLEALLFRMVSMGPGKFHRCCDWFFAEDCNELGISQKCDLSMICGHIETEPVPRILWPDVNVKGMYRSVPNGEWPEFEKNELIYARET